MKIKILLFSFFMCQQSASGLFYLAASLRNAQQGEPSEQFDPPTTPAEYENFLHGLVDGILWIDFQHDGYLVQLKKELEYKNKIAKIISNTQNASMRKALLNTFRPVYAKIYISLYFMTSFRTIFKLNNSLERALRNMIQENEKKAQYVFFKQDTELLEKLTSINNTKFLLLPDYLNAQSSDQEESEGNLNNYYKLLTMLIMIQHYFDKNSETTLNKKFFLLDGVLNLFSRKLIEKMVKDRDYLLIELLKDISKKEIAEHVYSLQNIPHDFTRDEIVKLLSPLALGIEVDRVLSMLYRDLLVLEGLL
ncbi:MAG: hypothetical protein WC707_06590 [Candidatus Babeliaceae bacterium]|jgi:hypothetical protein